ncbi:MAG: GNAT family N-acetyltransferase [Pseudomonadota bacterium]
MNAAAGARPAPFTGATARSAGAVLEAPILTVHGSVSDAEASWRSLEDVAAITPYQRFDWLATWQMQVGSRHGLEPFIIEVRAHGEPLAILPMTRRVGTGLRIVEWMGGRDTNANLPLVHPTGADSLLPERITQLLGDAAAHGGGVDLYALANQPLAIGAWQNPFAALRRSPAPSPGFGVPLTGDFQTFALSRRTGRSLQTLRRKRRNLERKRGAVRFQTAKDPYEVEAALATFFDQRAARFRDQGIRNSFNDDALHTFIEDRARATSGGQPVLMFHTLTAGDTIVATYGGIRHGAHYSCYVNSFTHDPDLARFSPGDILLHDLLQHLCSNGVRTFDIGIGRERYKANWCDEIPLFDSILPMTGPGHLLALTLGAKMRAKSAIKGNDRLWALTKSLRARTGGGRAIIALTGG